MEIGKRLRLELEKILQRTETKFTLEELARELEKKGRLAPCLYFSGLTSDCMQLGHELDCLNCPDYEPHEPPGPLDEAICEFELGKVYHVMEFAESDGCYRLGRTLCGRFVDERVDDADIYDHKAFSQRRPCRRCEARRRDREALLSNRT